MKGLLWSAVLSLITVTGVPVFLCFVVNDTKFLMTLFEVFSATQQDIQSLSLFAVHKKSIFADVPHSTHGIL